MVFSSVSFLFYFLPCVLILYFAAPKRLRNAVLLLSGLFFYAWGEPRYLLLMVFSILQGYWFGLLIERYRKKARVFMTVSVLISLGVLGYCKYADFFIETFNRATGLSLPLLNIALPIGISFYTFQILSYVVDIYRGEDHALRNPIDLGAYIAMFPQLIAGPIVRYHSIAGELTDRRTRLDDLFEGIRRFIIGLSKKVLIANLLGGLVEAFKASADPSVLFFWGYILAFTLQIYYDFSGYSDMAIGLGRIFGFHFPENFRYPYISGSITEFWRRWHISLGTWFRDYLYIPLGGNRVKKPRWLLNIAVVWIATGLWHGAAWNFVLWGLFFAFLLMIEKLGLLTRLQKHKYLGRVYTLLLVLFGFVLFDASGLGEALYRIAALLGLAGRPVFSTEGLYYLLSYAVPLLLAAVGATPGPKYCMERLRTCRIQGAVHLMEPVVLLLLLTACTAFLVDGSFNPFLYFRF